MRRRALLRGHEFDLMDLARSFPDGADPCVVKDDSDVGFWMWWECPDHVAEGGAIATDAAQTLGVLNGIARVSDPTYRLVELAGRFTDERGHVHQVVQVETIEVRMQAGVVTITIDGQTVPSPPPREPSYYAVATTDADVREAVGFLASPTLDWVTLYKVWEIVERDLGGEKQLRRSLGVSRGDCSAFTGSANHQGVSGNDARHARNSGPPPKRQLSLAEGRTFITTVVRQWIESEAPDRD